MKEAKTLMFWLCTIMISGIHDGLGTNRKLMARSSKHLLIMRKGRGGSTKVTWNGINSSWIRVREDPLLV